MEEEIIPTTIDLNLSIVSSTGEKVMGSKLELVDMNSKQTVFKGNMTSDTYAMTAAENTQFAYKVKAREYFFTQGIVKLTSKRSAYCK